MKKLNVNLKIKIKRKEIVGGSAILVVRKTCLKMVERRIDLMMEIFEINPHLGEAK